MSDLLFLAQRLPYPPTKGEKIRAFHELKYLAQWYDIHLGCLIDDPDDRQYIDALRPLCRDIHVAQINRRTARLACLTGLLTADALSVMYFRHRGLIDWVNNVVDTVRPAITFVYSSNMAPYVLDLPNTGKTVVDLVDVDSEKWRAFANATKSPMRPVYRREWRKIAELERRIARHCALSALVSDAEAALFARHNPDCAKTIRGVSNGVDYRYFDPASHYPPPYDTTRPNFVFTGTMDYPPNGDAAAWFAAEILPLIQASLPAAQFHVVGSNPSPEVRKLDQRAGVFVSGRVPDVRPYIAHATAGVAPMRIARGIQNKVLEAMAMARPVVLTAGALEGIAAVPMLEAILADTAADFAAACCRLAITTDGVAIGAAARRRIISNYDWDATLRGFDDILRPGMPPAEAVHRSAPVSHLQPVESSH
ncbi:TIGR03087 family PEP-CTERM/XrtA system glycosyltransferase [Rhodopila sp.]|uniref:TIGR03087 family PEP-CTERM/XrtA system glycosyltransferase n=1 Tax=Rhodopila sp. TaxID=2480087 RepID=UPI003D1228A0